jgi:hypothetical protein
MRANIGLAFPWRKRFVIFGSTPIHRGNDVVSATWFSAVEAEADEEVPKLKMFRVRVAGPR